MKNDSHLRNSVLGANIRIEEAASTISLLPVSKRIIRDTLDTIVVAVFEGHDNIVRVGSGTSGIENPRTFHCITPEEESNERGGKSGNLVALSGAEGTVLRTAVIAKVITTDGNRELTTQSAVSVQSANGTQGIGTVLAVDASETLASEDGQGVEDEVFHESFPFVEVVSFVVCAYYTRGLPESQQESERNRKSATLALPTTYDGLNVVVSEGVGHIQPVRAVVRAGITVRSPRQSAPVVFDGVEEAVELAGDVSRLFHAPIIPHHRRIASLKWRKKKKVFLLDST